MKYTIIAILALRLPLGAQVPCPCFPATVTSASSPSFSDVISVSNGNPTGSPAVHPGNPPVPPGHASIEWIPQTIGSQCVHEPGNGKTRFGVMLMSFTQMNPPSLPGCDAVILLGIDPLFALCAADGNAVFKSQVYLTNNSQTLSGTSGPHLFVNPQILANFVGMEIYSGAVLLEFDNLTGVTRDLGFANGDSIKVTP